ncbi:hypothetical protein [Deinococcus sp. RL]|uniref:hypothetical protein n=1 Tax=Deinococcus sp. RL TaxID=1489678 RepID=UPI001268BDAB|nr:hypothetical protein [Deinococcus sp. RL]
MDPRAFLVRAVERAGGAAPPPVTAPEVAAALRRVMRCESNRAPARLVLACALAGAAPPGAGRDRAVHRDSFGPLLFGPPLRRGVCR